MLKKHPSKRLSKDRMSVIGDFFVPAVPGTSYHAILCVLLENKNKFVSWNRLLKLMEKYFVMYGGEEAWNGFSSLSKRKKKLNEEHVLKKIKAHLSVLMYRGKKYISYRLHQNGMVIYRFKDGAMIRTGGKFAACKGRRIYDVMLDGESAFQKTDTKKLVFREYKDIIGGNWEDENEIDLFN